MEVCYSKKGGVNLIMNTCDVDQSDKRGESKINLDDQAAITLALVIIYKVLNKPNQEREE